MSLLPWTTKRLGALLVGSGKSHNELTEGSSVATGLGGVLDLPTSDIETAEGETAPDEQDDAAQLLSADVLLKLEDTSGSTAVDSIAGVNATINGTVTYSVSGGFANNANGITLGDVADYFSWASDYIGGTAHTIAFVYERNQASDVTMFYQTPDTNSVLTISTLPDIGLEDDGGVNSDAYPPADGSTFYYTFTANFSTGDIFFYLNGLPFANPTGSTTNNINANSGTAIAYDGSNGDAFGTWYYFSHSNTVATPEEVHNSWQQLSDMRHWFYTYVVGKGLTTFGDSASDIDFHFPLIEDAGSTALDVSMNSNHGAYLGTIGVNTTLAQTALSQDALYSIQVDGTAGGISVAPSIDMSAADWTFFIEFDSTSSSANEAVWSMQDSGVSSYIGHARIGSASEFRFYDGSTVAGITGGGVYDDGLVHRIVCRHDATAQQIDLWEDGSYIGSASTSALSMPSYASQDLYIGERGTPSFDEFVGNISLPCLFKSALADADCLFLSSGV